MKTPEQHRAILPVEHPYHTVIGEPNGLYFIPTHGGNILMCLATNGDDEIPWEHVSVSVKRSKKGKLHEINRTPTWEEMCTVKDLFWDENEAVIQFHPPESEYVSQHKYTLHLWKKRGYIHETPPSIAVGYKIGKDID